ncbi:MAG: fumarate hydratase [Patescibacteria group bacterium]|jgi:tartrate/fumarate subfamily iron-sulfur-dependent hydro-lyase alpha chain
MELKEKIVNLYRRTANVLPEDVILALEKAEKIEDNPVAKEIFKKLIENTREAKGEEKPICQDTGTPYFYVEYPEGHTQKELTEIIEEATIEATSGVPLRPNAVNCLTGKNIGNKPVIHFKEGKKLKINLMLKGGGSENVSAIYSLPNIDLKADRNLEGVRKCVLDAVFKAQGKACPPYIIGVALAGNLEEAASISKKQLLRKLNDKNPEKELFELEEKVLAEINELLIGPAGLGGKTTALGVKIASGVRHPASFFVGIAISCWAMRRQSL